MMATPPIVTIAVPSYNQGRFLDQALTSIFDQGLPVEVFVADAGSTDGSLDVIKKFEGRLAGWRSHADRGQAAAINEGIASGRAPYVGWLNSDDTLLPGTLAYVAHVFRSRPDIDIVYGQRIFIDGDGMEIGRAVFPTHDARALNYIGYVPQETMFWRRRVWDRIGPIDESFRFALDWDFMLRAQQAGFQMVRLPRFLGCFRIHAEQKTSAMMEV